MSQSIHTAKSVLPKVKAHVQTLWLFIYTTPVQITPQPDPSSSQDHLV